VFHDWRLEVILRQHWGLSSVVDGYERTQRRGVVDRTKPVEDGRSLAVVCGQK
jgi:hypothetical protein